jgi:hypothetical protein
LSDWIDLREIDGVAGVVPVPLRVFDGFAALIDFAEPVPISSAMNESACSV